MISRARISILGAAVFLVGLAALPFINEAATAAPLRQIPPTSPLATPVPTDTPQPANTPIPPTIPPTQQVNTPTSAPPQPGTPTPAPPAHTPHPGGGGGAPPGPSGTPVINGCVKSVGKNGVNLSTAPGFYQPPVLTIPRGQLAQVLAGPQRADTIWWWLLRAESGAEGWGNQDDMTPDPGPCAFGASASSGAATPPYPVTILPASSIAQPTIQATPAQQGALPQTGDSLGWWFLAGLLAVTMIVVGFVRRRLQTQPAARSKPEEDEYTDIKQR